jgi:outer membrane protein
MTTRKDIPALAVMLALSVACEGALAADNNTVRFGLYAVLYHASGPDVSGPYTPTGLNADVPNVQTLYFAYLRRLTTHLQVEVAGGLPPDTDTVGKGPATVGSVPFNGQVLGHVKWLSPSALLNYTFFDETHAWRPYVGVGVNYTHFYDRETTAAGNAVLGGPTSISQSNSWGPAASVGISFRPKQHWEVITSFNWARVKSDLQLNTAGVVRQTTIDFHPTAFVFAMGYSF